MDWHTTRQAYGRNIRYNISCNVEANRARGAKGLLELLLAVSPEKLMSSTQNVRKYHTHGRSCEE